MFSMVYDYQEQRVENRPDAIEELIYWDNLKIKTHILGGTEFYSGQSGKKNGHNFLFVLYFYLVVFVYQQLSNTLLENLCFCLFMY